MANVDCLLEDEKVRADGVDASGKTKARVMRKAMIGAAAVALALCMTACNGGGNATTATNDTPAASTDSSDTSAAESASDDQVDDNIDIPSEDPNGLSASQVINDYMTVNSGVDTMMASEYIKDWMADNGYATPIAEPIDSDDYLLRGSGLFSFQCSDGSDRGATMIFGLSEDAVDIIIRETAVDREDNEYTYTADAIPTADQAREIAQQRLH